MFATSFLKRTIVLLGLSISLIGCKKDEENSLIVAPEFAGIEIGTANTKTAYAGQDFHIEATLKAGANLSGLKVQITPVVSGRGWSFSQIYTKDIKGLKNAVFHEHLLVPEDAVAGEYDLLLVLTDESGGRSEYKSTIKIIKNPMLPSASLMSVVFDGNSDLQLSGRIKAPNNLEFIKVEIQSTLWTRIYDFNGVDVENKTEFDLSEVIDMRQPPKGHYHVNITIADQKNNRLPLSYHLDK